MAVDNGAEIDLYDNIEEDFVQDSNELTELYDDVIAQTSTELSSNTHTKTIHNSQALHNGRRIATYVGNLTWWTTDVDLFEAFSKLNIADVLEIKFHENRQNGQSKGFCVVVFGSEQSVRIAMEKLPKLELNGQVPLITYCTKHNLSIFEKASGTETSTQGSSSSREGSSSTSGILGVAATTTTNITSSRTSGSSSNGRLPPPLMGTPALTASLGFSTRRNSSLMGRASSNSSQNSTGALPLALSGLQHNFQTGLLLPSAINMQLQSGLSSNQTSGMLSSAFNFSNAITTSLAGSNAHINPNFLQGISENISRNSGNAHISLQNPLLQSTGLHPQIDQFGRPLVHTYTPTQIGKLKESEFDDILQRNKTVSSSAINRAVQDAAGGNYGSAIETLVTAISLIKQSKIANDDRCKILINSLQDTLHGIESKSYGYKTSSRRRRRSFSDTESENGDAYIEHSETGGGSVISDRHNRTNRDKHRSRSRDHHIDERRERSRDKDHERSSRDYYNSSAVSNLSSTSLHQPTTSSSINRYRESRYRQ